MPSPSSKSIPLYQLTAHRSRSTDTPSFFIFIKKIVLLLSFLSLLIVWFFPIALIAKGLIAWTAMVYVLSRGLRFAAKDWESKSPRVSKSKKEFRFGTRSRDGPCPVAIIFRPCKAWSRKLQKWDTHSWTLGLLDYGLLD
jgi:hypothetical protein